MNNKGFDKFLQLLMEDNDAQEKMKSIGSDMDALADWGKKLGYDVTAEQLRGYQEKSLAELRRRMGGSRRQEAPLSGGAREFYALLDLAETDSEVNRRMEELSDSSPEQLIAYGKEKGFTFDAEDIKAVGRDILESSEELSEEELELVSGGTTVLLFVGILAFGAFALGTAGVAVAVAFAVSKKKG